VFNIEFAVARFSDISEVAYFFGPPFKSVWLTSMMYSVPSRARIALTAAMSSPPNSLAHSSTHSLNLQRKWSNQK